LSLRDNKKAAGGEWMRFKENPKRWAPCDEAPAVRCASVRKTPCWRLHVIFGIWIGPKAQLGSVAWKVNSKNVN
jgi:hypothetical protein